MPKLCSVLYTATVPSSKLQQFQISGTSCLEPTTWKDLPHLCSIPLIVFSANGLSETFSLIDQTNFFHLQITGISIYICFGDADPFYQKFGDVNEVLVQEYCPIHLYALCTNISLIGLAEEVQIFGSRGIITLDSNGTGLLNSSLLL